MKLLLFLLAMSAVSVIGQDTFPRYPYAFPPGLSHWTKLENGMSSYLPERLLFNYSINRHWDLDHPLILKKGDSYFVTHQNDERLYIKGTLTDVSEDRLRFKFEEYLPYFGGKTGKIVKIWYGIYPRSSPLLDYEILIHERGPYLGLKSNENANKSVHPSRFQRLVDR